MYKEKINSLGIQNQCPNEIKNKILKEGMWAQFTERLKYLLKSQDEFWRLYEKESSVDSQIRILEDIVNIQATIHDWYTASRKFVGADSGVYK